VVWESWPFRCSTAPEDGNSGVRLTNCADNAASYRIVICHGPEQPEARLNRNSINRRKSMENSSGKTRPNRRHFLKEGLRTVIALGTGTLSGLLIGRSGRQMMVWQIDPEKCVQCGRCATDCVLEFSAVKCVHAYDVCGYCELCGGYSKPDALELDTAAENQLCPTGAIRRTFIEDPFFEYTIDESVCIGCGKCVKGCASFGNGSLYLQVRHDRCVHCNDCAIARNCAGEAFRRVPADHPYILKGEQGLT
jgi:electron transport complex protein RnfB